MVCACRAPAYACTSATPFFADMLELAATASHLHTRLGAIALPDAPWFNRCCQLLAAVRAHGRAPALWNRAQAVFLPKPGCPPSCDGLRLAALLDPPGKCSSRPSVIEAKGRLKPCEAGRQDIQRLVDEHMVCCNILYFRIAFDKLVRHISRYSSTSATHVGRCATSCFATTYRMLHCGTTLPCSALVSNNLSCTCPPRLMRLVKISWQILACHQATPGPVSSSHLATTGLSTPSTVASLPTQTTYNEQFACLEPLFLLLSRPPTYRALDPLLAEAGCSQN